MAVIFSKWQKGGPKLVFPKLSPEKEFYFGFLMTTQMLICSKGPNIFVEQAYL